MNLVSEDKNQIGTALANLTYIHPLIIKDIAKHGETTMEKLSNEYAKMLLGNSIHVISGIAESIIEGEEINDGWRELTRTCFEHMNDSFKDFYLSYFEENSIDVFTKYDTDDPPLFLLHKEFRDITKDDMQAKGIKNPYSWIISYIGEYRNRTRHNNRMSSIPIDPITSKPTHGNLYTLISSYNLGLYAFLELVRYWDAQM